ncbi:MAG: hypothetical protein K0B15_12580 [Lentimicrobium sp.]|nr:hypothetical protein [Lentimicrobium sp.]
MQIHLNKGYNNKKPPKVFATLPVLSELENISVIIKDIENQNYPDWTLLVCVNQPDEWWLRPDKKHICNENAETIAWLNQKGDSRIQVIDRSSPDLGWKGKKHGVGWARKTAMDLASNLAGPLDVILSLDADTRYPSGYFSEVVYQLHLFPEATGLAAPYYHLLTGNDLADRCILRYEIYMRNYSLNMLKINNPYCFSAIGSGMACTAKIYRRLGGLTPKLSGEDFYFIQKLRKSGNVIIHCETVIHPAARFSDRVYFGTGPAMIKGRDGKWESYPIYSQDSFKKIEQTFMNFSDLFLKNFPVPMQEFIDQMGNDDDFWTTLRNNSTSEDAFIKACTLRLDGLRILQFLKYDNMNYFESDEKKLEQFFKSGLFADDEIAGLQDFSNFSNCSVAELDAIRNLMFKKERSLQKEIQLS